MVSPISNSKFTNIYYDFFLNWQTEKKNLFWTNKKFVFFFSTAQTEKNSWKQFVKQIGKNIRWIRYWACRARSLQIVFREMEQISKILFWDFF